MMKNKIKNILTIAIVSYILTGCNIYSQYQRAANTEQIDSLYLFIQATEDTTNIASLPWKEFFTDKKLQSLIQEALENNTNLNLARLNVEQGEIALNTARLAYLPSISAVPQVSVSNFNNTTSQTYNLSGSASWEIDIFGRLRNAKERSKSALEQSKAYRQAVQTELIATIANTYYSLLMLDKQLDISRRTQANWQKNLEVVKALKKAGKMNQTSVLQAQANKIALGGSIISIQKQIQELENSLCTLLTTAPRKINRGSIENIKFDSDLSIGVPLQLLSNRPDVRMAEHNLAQMFYATNQARSELYPKITLSGAAGFGNSAGIIINPGKLLLNAVASIVQPIFNRGTLQAQVKISKSQQEQALLEFNQSLLDAGAEVNNALIQFQSAKERLALDTAQIDILQQAVQSSELLMQYGNTNYLEVLTVQLSLLQSELTQTSNTYDQTQGIISLYRALGGGEK